MMDWTRGPSRSVTLLQVFCAVDFYIVFDSYDREAVVPSGPAEGRPDLRAGGAGLQVLGWPNG
jgi:hypothetical protein